MVAVIVAMDQLIWRPVIAWAEKFKFEQVAGVQVPHSAVLDLLRGSRVLSLISRLFISPARERLSLFLAREWPEWKGRPADRRRTNAARWVSYTIVIVVSIAIAYAAIRMTGLAASVNGFRIAEHLYRRRCDFPASRIHPAARSFMDGACRSGDRLESEAIGHTSAHCSDRSLRARDSIVSDHHSSPCAGRRRTGDWLDPADASGDTVVHPLQCHRWRDRFADGFERSLRHLPVW